MTWRPIARRQLAAIQATKWGAASTAIIKPSSTLQVAASSSRPFHQGHVCHFSQAAAPAKGAARKSKPADEWSTIIANYGKSDATLAQEAAAATAGNFPRIVARTRRDYEVGSRYSRRLRQGGHIPGVLYGIGSDGQKDRVLLVLERAVIERLVQKYEDSFGCTVFDLVVDEKPPERVIATGLHRDPGNAVMTAVNFLRYRPGYPVKIPVCFVNEELCLPIKRGGMMISLNRFIKCCCEGETVPEMLMADMTGLETGQRVTLDRVTFPPGVKVHQSVPADYNLGVVHGKSTRGEKKAAAAEAAAKGKGGAEEEEE